MTVCLGTGWQAPLFRPEEGNGTADCNVIQFALEVGFRLDFYPTVRSRIPPCCSKRYCTAVCRYAASSEQPFSSGQGMAGHGMAWHGMALSNLTESPSSPIHDRRQIVTGLPEPFQLRQYHMYLSPALDQQICRGTQVQYTHTELPLSRELLPWKEIRAQK